MPCAVVELLLRTPGGRVVRAARADDDALALELLDAEVFHRLDGLEKGGVLTAERATQLTGLLRDAPLTRFAHHALLRPAVRYRAAVSGYDALYLALAGLVGATLVTTDALLARTCAEQFARTVTTVPTSRRSRQSTVKWSGPA